jgi:hypothetical protein
MNPAVFLACLMLIATCGLAVYVAAIHAARLKRAISEVAHTRIDRFYER